MLVLVPTVKTPITTENFIRACIKSWYNIYNTLPEKKSVAVIYAQWGLETGLSAFCWSNNIGNVKAIDDHNPNTIVKYQMLSNTWEIINGKKIVFQPPHQATWFRAFDTLDEGMTFHMEFLRNKRYKTAWSAVENGSPSEFAHLLKQAGYYTAPESDYIKAMLYHFNIFMKGHTFDKVIKEIQLEIQDNLYKIDFPIEYKSLEFNTINDSVSKQEKLKISPTKTNFIKEFINKFRNFSW